MFVHISAVERAGLQGLHEGQKISYDVVNERGKDAAANLKALSGRPWAASVIALPEGSGS